MIEWNPMKRVITIELIKPFVHQQDIMVIIFTWTTECWLVGYIPHTNGMFNLYLELI